MNKQPASENKAVTPFATIKREIRDTLSLGIPLITSQLVYALSGFIGTAFVAHLGQDALAASVLVSMIWMTLSVLFFGLLNAVSVLVSHEFGAKNYKNISHIMGQSFILAAILMIILFGLMSVLPLMLTFTHQPPHVLALATQYMHALLWTIPGLLLLITYEQFFAGIHRTKLVLRISVLVVPIEIPLIYLLVFGKFGLPACGIAGIGYGFALTYTGTAICLTFYLAKNKTFKIFHVFKQILSIDLSKIAELFRVGIPMGCMHVIEVSAFMVATLWMADFGTTMLAAHQIMMQYLGFFITIVFAMAQAVTVRVGYAVGEKNFPGVKNAIYYGMALNFFVMLCVAIAFNLIPSVFLRLDMNISQPQNFLLLHDASVLLSIGGVLMLFDNFRIIGFGALRGLKDTQFPMYASFIAFWGIGLTSAYLFAFHLHLAGRGIWWGLTLGIAIGAIIVFIRVRSLLKKMIF